MSNGKTLNMADMPNEEQKWRLKKCVMQTNHIISDMRFYIGFQVINHADDSSQQLFVEYLKDKDEPVEA